jgi:hypothetical protein
MARALALLHALLAAAVAAGHGKTRLYFDMQTHAWL